MANDKRVVSRREPIVVSVEGVADFAAHPLPWRKRNDLGNLISEEYIRSLNDILGDAEPTAEGAPRQVGKISLIESGMNYIAYLELAFPDNSTDDYEALDFEAIVAVLSAALEINGLDRLLFMVNPAVKGPETEPEEAEQAADGARIESLPVSSSQEFDQPSGSN